MEALYKTKNFPYAHVDIDKDRLTNSGVLVFNKVEKTFVKHRQLVQFRASDWDFLVSRADANGKIVFTNDDTVRIEAAAAGATYEKPDRSSLGTRSRMFRGAAPRP